MTPVSYHTPKKKKYSIRCIPTYHRHLGVTKLVPEILDCVQTNKSSDKETNKLDTANASNANTGEEQPKEPLRFKAVVTLVVEFGPAENCSNCAAQKHRVKQDESADSRVRVFAENHESNEPDSGTA